MNNKKRYRPYEERFIVFANFFEKLILKILIVFLLGLVISQFLLTFDGLREILVPVESLEGSISIAKSVL